MIIYFATWLNEPNQGKTLTKKKEKSRLISYYHASKRKNEFVKYVKTGRNDKE